MLIPTLHLAVAACLLNEAYPFVNTPSNVIHSKTYHKDGGGLHELHAFANTYWDQNTAQYEVKFVDDFNGDAIDTSVWNYFTGKGPGNGEQQLYTDSDKNAFVKDSVLHVRALREDTEYDGEMFHWTSARLDTMQKFNFTFGRMSARVRCKPVDGPFSAVWALSEKSEDEEVGWPKCGEIDFFEMQTLWDYTPSTLHFEEHCYGNSMSFFSYEAFETVEDWHIYGVEWDEKYIAFYHDGKRIGEYPRPIEPAIRVPFNWPYDWQNKFYLIINNAMNPDWGKHAKPDLMQHDLEVDWIKVEQKKPQK